MNRGIPLAVGKVLEVFQRDDTAIFLNVGLRTYRQEDGTPEATALEVRVRWGVGYHGPGFGDWHVPEIGSDVLCFFPGVSPDGAIGDELGNGIAAFCWSNKIEPPIVTGVNGDLSATRRVYLGRSGEAEDRRIRGDLDHQVDGDEKRETKGTFEWTFRGAMQFIGDLAVLVKSLTTLTLHGVAKVDIISGTDVSITVGATSVIITPTSVVVTGLTDLGGPGGAAVARVGDSVSGGVITTGSALVKAL